MGMYLTNSAAVVDSNVFENNSHGAVYSFGAAGSFTDNSGSGNLPDGISLACDFIRPGENFILKPNSLPYIFSRDIFTVGASSTLTVEKGVTIKNEYSWLKVYGGLSVNGDGPDDVVFTSTVPFSGLWQGITVYDGASADIKGATIGYANTGISYVNSPIQLSNREIFQ